MLRRRRRRRRRNRNTIWFLLLLAIQLWFRGCVIRPSRASSQFCIDYRDTYYVIKTDAIEISCRYAPLATKHFFSSKCCMHAQFN